MNLNRFKEYFSFKNIFLIIFYIFIFSILLKNSYSYLDPDLGWHLKFGQEILQNKSVPHIEHYDFPLLGERWVDHEWLINLISYFIYSNFGYFVLNLFFAIIGLLLFIFINNTLFKKYNFSILGYFLLFFIEIIGLFGILPHFGIRMQEITVLFLLLLFFIIYRFDKFRNYKILFLLFPLFYFWSSMHAGFLIGLFVLFVFIVIRIFEYIFIKNRNSKFLKFFDFSYVEEWKKKDIIVFLIFSFVLFLITCFTFYGLEFYLFLFTYRDTFYMTHIVEWLPAYFLPINMYQFFYLAIVISFLLVCFYFRKLKKINLFLTLLVIIFLFLAFQAKRHFPLLFICSLFFIAEYLDFVFHDVFFEFKNDSKIIYIIKSFIICFFLLLCFYVFISIKFIKDPFVSFASSYPVDLVDCIKNEKINNQRIFAEYGWGGYLIWMSPEVKIFLDGRLPQYPINGHTMLEEYYNFYEIENTENLLDKYDIKLVLTKRNIQKIKLNWLEKCILGQNEKKLNENRKNNLKDYLSSSKKWTILCSGNAGIVYIRTKP